MDIKYKKYFFLLLIHVILGAIIFGFPVLSKIYGILIMVTGITFIIKNKNQHNEVLFASAYIVGAEVFLRMTYGNPVYEFGKYGVILFSLLGIYYSGISKKTWPYWLALLLLIPGVVIAAKTLNAPIFEKIVFDFSGPVCLVICSLYTCRKRINVEEMHSVLLSMGLPIISCCVYLFLYSPAMKDIHFNTEASFILSGNFGPNQVATALGLGIFVFFSRLIYKSPTVLTFTINLLITSYICYRGILTFARGGMITSLAMVLVLMVLVCLNSKVHTGMRLRPKMVLVFVTITSIILLTSYQSGGYLNKRYANKDNIGRERRHLVTGRLKLAVGEIMMFAENPVLGIGTGMGKETRIKNIGRKISTHNEMSRLLAEHGSLGLMALLILIVTPLLLYTDSEPNVYFFLFFIFWVLTINHTGMRTAAPSFMYALALLNIDWKRNVAEL